MSFYVMAKFIFIYAERLQFLRTSPYPLPRLRPWTPLGDFRLPDPLTDIARIYVVTPAS